MKKISVFLTLLLTYPSLALAGFGLEDANGGLPTGDPSASYSDRLSVALGSVVGSFLAFLGVVFLILMIVGGLKWMTALGDEKKVKSAKDLLGAAVVGLIIVISAYTLTAYLSDSILP